MSNNREHLFQIKVLDFSKRKNNWRSPFVLFDSDGNVPAGNIIDRPEDIPSRTLLKRFKNNKSAMRYGQRYGTVISCRKVDPEYYLKNIEYLNLKQEPITIPIDREEYIINKDLEIQKPRRRYSGKKYDVEIVDNDE